MTRSGTTRLHRRAQAQREAGRRGSTHPGAQPSAIRSSSRTRVGQASAPPTYRPETLSSRARQRVGRSHPNATKPCRAGRGSESGAQRRKMHASHKRRGPGGTHFNQDQRASGTGLPIAQNPGLKLLWDHQAFAKRVTSPRTPTTTTHVQTIASVLGEKYAKGEPVGARRRGTGRPASPLLRIP